MAKILKISSPKGKNILKLRLFDEERGEITLTVSEALYRRTGCPLAGEEVDDEALACFAEEDEQRRADARALRLLEYADNNELMIKRKLISAGFSKEVAEESAKRMVMLGYINEERQLSILVEREANRALRGPKRILGKLAAKGYAIEEIKRVISRLCESGEIDFKHNAELLAEKHGVTAGSEEARLLLYKNGY
ncbi:MAG: RecX family transcriptional regulator [Clostridia bacterium]|nr:RecX family transcriptional regulator [Clostridia bacterium]